jgi:molybdate transport system substrate-binding protein
MMVHRVVDAHEHDRMRLQEQAGACQRDDWTTGDGRRERGDGDGGTGLLESARLPRQIAVLAATVLIPGMCGLVLGTAGCAQGQDSGEREPLFVLAAVSLTEAMQEAGAQYAAAGEPEVRHNFAASNVLARQIREGIAGDEFVSADERQMDALAEAGAIAVDSRVALVGTDLVVMVRPGLEGQVASPQDLLGPAVRRIAIGDPAGVPAGVYAREYLQRSGLWPSMASRLVPTTSVRAALVAVDNGHADAAMVYRSDTGTARRARLAFRIIGPHAPRIVFPAAVLAGSRHRERARAFVGWLTGREASAILRRHGFVPLSVP